MQGKGVDIILDCVGAPYLERNMTCLATDGCVVYIGWMGGKALTCLCGTNIDHLSPSLFDLDVEACQCGVLWRWYYPRYSASCFSAVVA